MKYDYDYDDDVKGFDDDVFGDLSVDSNDDVNDDLIPQTRCDRCKQRGGG